MAQQVSSPLEGSVTADRLVFGIVLVLAGSFFFVLQDAGMKWLTAELAVLQIIFLRNVLGLAFIVGGVVVSGQKVDFAVASRGKLFLRTAIYITGWCCFFVGLKYLPLATAAALFFSFPIILTALSVPLLGESVGFRRWTAVVFGFAGVVLMTKPGSDFSWPSLLMLMAALCWTLVVIMTRKLGKTVNATTMMLYALTGFVLVMTLVQFWAWRPIDAEAFGIIAFAALVGVSAQFCMTRAYSMAPPAVMAPFEYSGLVWAALVGFLLWGDVPDGMEIAGAAMIVASGLYICHRETGMFRLKSRAGPT